MRKRKKFMSEEEFNLIRTQNWIPVKIPNNTRPDWLKGLPEEKIYALYGSASLELPNPEADRNKTLANQIGGIDVYRVAEEKDGVKLNKDWYRLMHDVESNKIYVLGPYRDKEHHIDLLPERLTYIDVIKME